MATLCHYSQSSGYTYLVYQLDVKLVNPIFVHCRSTMIITHLYKTPYHTKLERIETAYDGRKEGALPGARLAPPAPSEVSRYS